MFVRILLSHHHIHRYVGYGLDPHLASEIMTPQFLDKQLSTDIVDIHTQFAKSAELWVGESAAAWHSGRDGVTNAWCSSFWFADTLGHLAQYNHTGFCRQTLVGGNYGLLNRTTFSPNPDWFVSKLYKKLMGDIVLRPTVTIAEEGGSDMIMMEGYLRIYAQ